jgi:AraC-like DNA-binding protein
MLWAWDDYHPPHPKERILPGGMIEITVSLSDVPFKIQYESGDNTPFVINGPMAAGARSKPFIIDTSQPTSLLSMWFKPGGTLPFFGVPGKELHNRHLPLESLWGRSVRDLHERLMAARTTPERFRILEQTLTQRLLQSRQRHQAVAYALQQFWHGPHSQTVADVVDAVALSPTRFIDVFRADVGLTPKQFCRVQRFQRALNLSAYQPDQPWAEIALNCGYYDQAHFINDFRAFSGITPSAYRPQSRDHNTNLPVFDL